MESITWLVNKNRLSPVKKKCRCDSSQRIDDWSATMLLFLTRVRFSCAFFFKWYKNLVEIYISWLDVECSTDGPLADNHIDQKSTFHSFVLSFVWRILAYYSAGPFIWPPSHKTNLVIRPPYRLNHFPALSSPRLNLKHLCRLMYHQLKHFNPHEML